MEKVCVRCERALPLDHFNKRSTAPDGLQYHCRDCGKKFKAERVEHTAAKNAEWYRRNKSRHRAGVMKYRETHMHVWRNADQKRRATLRGAEIGWIPADPKAELIKTYGAKCLFPDCPVTNEQSLEIDHIVPLSKGGRHAFDNFQLLCKSHNSSKGNYNSIDYRPLNRS